MLSVHIPTDEAMVLVTTLDGCLPQSYAGGLSLPNYPAMAIHSVVVHNLQPLESPELHDPMALQAWSKAQSSDDIFSSFCPRPLTQTLSVQDAVQNLCSSRQHQAV